MMRLLALVMFIAGLALGIAYPWAVREKSGRDLGTLRLQDSAGGFHPVRLTVAAGDLPLRLTLDVTAVLPKPPPASGALFTLTATQPGRTLLASAFDGAGAVVRDDAPQTPQQIYRIEIGTIDGVAPGEISFTPGPGDAEGIDLQAVDLLVTGRARSVDERAQPLGFSLAAIGFILLVLSFRSSARTPANPNSQPPPPRWGRGGDTR